MADYAGEPIRIATKDALNFDGKPLTPIDVDTVTCEVWNTDFTVKVQDVTIMDFVDDPTDEDNGNWVFTWDTTGREPGTYKARVTFNMISGPSSWEYKRIRLARDPHPGP
jgi:hypothetical protein